MRYLIVGCNYGCEASPTQAFLAFTYPDVTFTIENVSEPGYTSNYAVYASGPFEARQLDEMRNTGHAFRKGFGKGYARCLDETGAHR